MPPSSVRCYPRLSTGWLGGVPDGTEYSTARTGPRVAGSDGANLASSCVTSPAAFDDVYAGRARR